MMICRSSHFTDPLGPVWLTAPSNSVHLHVPDGQGLRELPDFFATPQPRKRCGGQQGFPPLRPHSPRKQAPLRYVKGGCRAAAVGVARRRRRALGLRWPSRQSTTTPRTTSICCTI